MTTADQDALIEAHRAWAIDSPIRQFRARWANDGELESIALLALVKAARRFDPTKGASFRTYATWRIHGHIRSERRWLMREFGYRRHYRSERHRIEWPQDEQGRPIDVAGDPIDLDAALERARQHQILLSAATEARDRAIIARSLAGETQVDIARAIGLSEGRLSQLMTRIVARAVQLNGQRQASVTRRRRYGSKGCSPAGLEAHRRAHLGRPNWRSGQTHCQHGHAFTSENTCLSHGHRSCRACARARYHARRAGAALGRDQKGQAA